MCLSLHTFVVRSCGWHVFVCLVAILLGCIGLARFFVATAWWSVFEHSSVMTVGLSGHCVCWCHAGSSESQQSFIELIVLHLGADSWGVLVNLVFVILLPSPRPHTTRTENASFD